jgi:Crinkler effector protein N-terminal domain
MSDTLRLYCLVQGDDTCEAFPLDVTGDKTVGDLKKAIKEDQFLTFQDVQANTMKIWKVSISY